MADKKLSLNHESAEALREFSAVLPIAAENIQLAADKLYATYQSIADDLGAHAQDFDDLLLRISKSQINATDAIAALVHKLNKTADGIDAYVASKRAIGVASKVAKVATAAIASVIPSPAAAPQQQYIDTTISKTEVVRSIDHYSSDNQNQGKISQDYLELKERRKKTEGEAITSSDVPAGAGGDTPEGETNIKYTEDENGLHVVIEINKNEVVSQEASDKKANDKQDVYISSDGMRVTSLSKTSSSSPNKKYTDGVVFEGELTFGYKRQKHTVLINRKIHQYASGIDLNYMRSDGKTNYEAMLKGESPIILIQTPNGIRETRLDLHHLTQQEVLGFPNAHYLQGTLAEVPIASHQKFTKIIHMRYPRIKGIRRSFRVVKLPNHKYELSKENAQFEEFRALYWKVRAEMLKDSENKYN